MDKTIRKYTFRSQEEFMNAIAIAVYASEKLKTDHGLVVASSSEYAGSVLEGELEQGVLDHSFSMYAYTSEKWSLGRKEKPAMLPFSDAVVCFGFVGFTKVVCLPTLKSASSPYFRP